MMTDTMPGYVFSRIEGELRSLPLTLLRLAERRREAMTQHATFGELRTIERSDPTFATVARLCEADIMHMEAVCRAVSAAFKSLDADLREFMKWHYFWRQRFSDVAFYLGMDDEEAKRARGCVVASVAYALGRSDAEERWWGVTSS